MFNKLIKILFISLLLLTVYTINTACEDKNRDTVYTAYFNDRVPTDSGKYNTVLVYVKTEDGVDPSSIGMNVVAYPETGYYCVGHYRTVQLLPWASVWLDKTGIIDDEDIRILLDDTAFDDCDFGNTPGFDDPKNRSILNKDFDINRVTFTRMNYWNDGGELGNNTKAFESSHWHLEAIADKYKLTVNIEDQTYTSYIKSNETVDLSKYSFDKSRHFTGWSGYSVENNSFAMPRCDVTITAEFGTHADEGNMVEVKAKQKSCYEDGNIDYYICSCGKYFIDALANIEIDIDAVVIPAGHEYDEEYSYNMSKHWHECSLCHDIDVSSFADHEFVNNENCICGFAYMDYEVSVIGSDIWYSNSKRNLTFKSTADYSYFKEVLVDGEVIDTSYYKSYEGSTYVELLVPYLKTLPIGEHILTIRSIKGEGSTGFKILKMPSSKSYTPPKTGIR